MQSRFLMFLAVCLLWAGMALAEVNINTAGQDELDSLKGVGPAKAKAIVDYRKKYGPFKSVDELKNVKGFGDKVVDGLRAEVTVGALTRAPAALPSPARKNAEAPPSAVVSAKPAVPARPAMPAAASGAKQPTPAGEKNLSPAPARPGLPAKPPAEVKVAAPATPIAKPAVPAPAVPMARPASPLPAKPASPASADAKPAAPPRPAAPAQPAQPAAAN